MRRLLSKGFTLPELMIVIVVLGVLIGVLVTPLDDLYSANNQGLKEIVETGDVQGTLRDIESELVMAVEFDNANTVSDPSGSNGNTSSPTQWVWTGIAGDGTSNRVLIAHMYATTELPKTDTDGTRQLVYENDCTTPAINNIVYFVKDSVLYRRTIRSAATPLCNGLTIAQRTSCAVGVVSGACASAPRDAKLIDNVSSFTVNYYQNPNSTSTIANQYTSTSAPGNSQTVSITLTAGVAPAEKTSTIRITRLNGSTL